MPFINLCKLQRPIRDQIALHASSLDDSRHKPEILMDNKKIQGPAVQFPPDTKQYCSENIVPSSREKCAKIP